MGPKMVESEAGRRRFNPGRPIAGVAMLAQGDLGAREVTTAIEFLAALQRVYVAAALGVLAATAVLVWIVIRRRRRREAVPAALSRAALGLAATCLALIAAEAAAGAWLAWSHRSPDLPKAFAAVPGLPTTFEPGAESPTDLDVVVIGESSAEGVPYQKWLSVGRLVGWGLEAALPGRRVRVDVLAESGKRLEDMHRKLTSLTRKPELLIIYCGHNEFYARHAWSHEVAPYYLDDPGWSRPWSIGAAFGRVSPMVRLIEETLELRRVAAPPPRLGRRLIDAPSHTVAERAELLDDFRRRMESILDFCRDVGAIPVLIPPAGNDAGFEPDRSVLPPDVPRARREVFARSFEAARKLEATDPAGAETAYRALLERQPGFAETHFRLARLLEGGGKYEDAYKSYVAARDLDAHPLRCLTSFQEVYRELAASRGLILIDAQEVFRARHPRGLLDDFLFNDGFHPSLEGHVALAEGVLAGLKERSAFDWPEATPAPTLDLAEVAAHFGVGPATWEAVCANAVGFYHLIAPLRFDQAERLAKRDRYKAALDALKAGADVESLDLPGVGPRPVRERLKP
ncbi:SGNH/GDSL hydrolase family protein [Planctomyces sp. SH-PL62]|uniref:SGNH/GDSL hydrolase family protein n=1 Tax=Planctomyces sp. SH-PL62 TaxID=1636152 RepID=UPI00078CCEDF|nr:hypothetical protein [Planctomyces sp. SH-PL62]AMV40367.1 hypothetical protein VT85_23250 [Planctomyces sp. SH-PL62]